MSPVVHMQGVSTGFKPLPATRECNTVFTGFKNGVSKAKNAVVNLEFTINEGEQADNGEDLGGRKVFRGFALTDNALWALKKALIQLGTPSNDPRLEDPDGFDTDEMLSELKGAEVKLQIEESEFEGKPSNNIEILDDLSW